MEATIQRIINNAQQEIQDLLNQEVKITYKIKNTRHSKNIRDIARVIQAYYEVDNLNGRTKEVAMCKLAICYFAFYYNITVILIQKFFGYSTHATVVLNKRHYIEQLRFDKSMQYDHQQIMELCEQLH